MKKMPSLVRALGCAVLLTLLAVCGYMGANRPVQTLSVAVTRQTLEDVVEKSTPQEIRERLRLQREQELSLLDSVIANGHTKEETLQSALAQKADITQRMESEAQILSSLAYMGYEGVSVVCGAQMVTVFVPEQLAQKESDRTKIIDAASTQTGLSAQSVKIMLVDPV